MQIHPALERVLGPHLDHPAVVDLLQKYPTPTMLKAAGKARLGTRLIKLAPRMRPRLAEEIFPALSEQPSSPWPAATATRPTPCCATAPFTKSDHHSRLDENHTGTPAPEQPSQSEERFGTNS